MKVAELAPYFLYPSTSRGEEAPDAPLEQFLSEIGHLSLAEQQILYTDTFDLGPACSPYAGVHLFGEQSVGRSCLMTGLRHAYAERGAPVDEGELPDHMAQLLRAAPSLADEEREELRTFVLRPALAKMREILRGTTNPYRHLVEAALSLTEGEVR